MEILGDATPDVPERDRRTRGRDAEVDLSAADLSAGRDGPDAQVLPDVGVVGNVGDVGAAGAGTGESKAPGLVPAVAGVLTCEALALTGLLAVLAGVLGFPPSHLWSEYGLDGAGYDPRAVAEFTARATGLLALLGTGLGVAAVLRLGPVPTRAARAIAGAAVLAGVLLLLYSGALLWHVAGLPPTPELPLGSPQ